MAPFVIWAMAAAAAGIMGLGIHELTKKVSGKRLVILGPRKSGKTTLRVFLEQGVIPKNYQPTKTTHHFDHEVRFGKLGLRLKGVDVSGDPSAYSVWRDELENTDLVCFLVSWPQLFEASTGQAARKAAKLVGQWKGDTKALLIVTHSDLAADLSDDEIAGAGRVLELRRLLGASDVVPVNLLQEWDQRELGSLILQALS